MTDMTRARRRQILMFLDVDPSLDAEALATARAACQAGDRARDARYRASNNVDSATIRGDADALPTAKAALAIAEWEEAKAWAIFRREDAALQLIRATHGPPEAQALVEECKRELHRAEMALNCLQALDATMPADAADAALNALLQIAPANTGQVMTAGRLHWNEVREARRAAKAKKAENEK